LPARPTRSFPRRHISAQGDSVPPSGHMGVWGGSLKARRGKPGGKKRGQRGRKKGTYARLDPFTRGQVVGLRNAGVPVAHIPGRVAKRDGSNPSLRAVTAVLAKAAGDPAWHGEDSAAGGRPPKLSAKVKKSLVSLVWKERGGHVVTIAFCKKRLAQLRDVVDNTVRNALHDAGLAWLRRRLKRFAPRRLHPLQAGAIVPPPSSPRPIYCHRCHRP